MDKKANLVKRAFNITLTGEKLYFLAFVLYFTSAFLITTTYLQFISFHWLNYISYLAMGLLAGKMFLFDRYTNFQVIAYILIVACALVTWIGTNTSLGFICVMFIIAARGIEFKKIVTWYFILGTIFMAFTFLSSEFGIIKNLVYHRSGATRQSFGIVYPTDFAAHIFFLILAYCYLWFEKLNWKNYISFAIIALLVIYFCDARLDAISIMLVIPTMYISKLGSYKEGLWQRISAIFWIGIPFLTVLVLLSSYFFTWGNSIFIKVNNLVSNRLSLSKQGFDQYGFSWFGQPIVEHGWGGIDGAKNYGSAHSTMSYFMLDSSLVRIFILYGSIFAIILLFALAVASVRQLSEHNYAFAAIVLLVMISSVVDQHLIDLAYNPFILGICAVFANKANVTKNVVLENGK